MRETAGNGRKRGIAGKTGDSKYCERGLKKRFSLSWGPRVERRRQEQTNGQ